MLGYSFVNLTPEQVEARRKILDRAGLEAYSLPIVLLLSIWLYRKLTSVPTKPTNPQSASTSTESFSRRVSWILNTTYIREFGPAKVQLVGLLYTTYLLWRIFHGTGEDYMHVTKAFGHVAVSQLPLHYLLSTKWSKSPITLATGLTNNHLNAYHRLFGRILHSLLAIHAILYLRFFALMNLLPKRIKDWDVRLGIIAFWSLNFLGILAIPPIRRKVYHKVFYRSHVL